MHYWTRGNEWESYNFNFNSNILFSGIPFDFCVVDELDVYKAIIDVKSNVMC